MWSLAELEKCRAVLYPELHPDTVKERYTQFGGVMRIVLDQRNNYSLENVLQGVSSRSAYRLLSLDVEDDRSVELHYLAHAQVGNLPQHPPHQCVFSHLQLPCCWEQLTARCSASRCAALVCPSLQPAGDAGCRAVAVLFVGRKQTARGQNELYACCMTPTCMC